MADRTVESLMRDAIRNAESGSAFITRTPVLGASLETILFSTTKGNKILCGVGIETFLAMSGGTVTAAAAKQGQMVDDIILKVDNQIRIKSSDAAAMIEFADLVIDKVQSDTILTAAGTARSYHIYPVSGVGGRQVQLDIDFAALSAMYSVGTEGAAKGIIITPFYSDMPMPQWSVITGGTPATGTGAYKLQLSGDFIGNGYLHEVVLIGDGTIITDDVRVIQEDGKLLLNQKAYLRAATGSRPLEAYWANIHHKVILTNSAGFFVNSSMPWNINSTLEVDVSTTGSLTYAAVFKNSPTSTEEKVVGAPGTPKPEPAAQPAAVPTHASGNTRNPTVGGHSNQRLGTGFKTGVARLLGT